MSKLQPTSSKIVCHMKRLTVGSPPGAWRRSASDEPQGPSSRSEAEVIEAHTEEVIEATSYVIARSVRNGLP